MGYARNASYPLYLSRVDEVQSLHLLDNRAEELDFSATKGRSTTLLYLQAEDISYEPSC